MTIKNFFKSTAMKCIVVLLCIALISGGLLSILNDVLAVSEEEKIQRVISSLYGDADVEATQLEIDEENQENSYGTINTVYSLSDGNMIINSTGTGGYKGGTVTVWTVVLLEDGKFAGIQSVSVDSYEKQTLMSQLNSKFFSNYSSYNDELKDGSYFSTSDGFVSTGATMSSNATNNAVNAAIKYVKIITGEETVSDLVNADSVKDVTYSVSGTAVTYVMTAISVSSGMPNNYGLTVTVDDGKITAIEVTSDGSTSGYGSYAKDVSSYIGLGTDELNALLSSSDIKTGATNSNTTIVNALIYATANYEYYLSGPVLADPVADMIASVYGEGVTYTSVDSLDPDAAASEYGTAEAAYTLSNGDMIAYIESGDSYFYVAAVLQDGVYDSIKATANSTGAVLSETTSDSENAEKAAQSFFRCYTGLDPILTYSRYVKDVEAKISGQTLTLSLTAISVSSGMPNNYSLTIVVKDGKISRASIASGGNGATYGYEDYVSKMSTYNGMTADELIAYKNSDEIKTGATNSNTTIVNALIYATANYEYYIPSGLTNSSYVKDVTVTTEGSTVTYTLTAISVSSGMPDNYGLQIAVTDGVIDSIEIVTDGSTYGYGSYAKDVSAYIGLGTDGLNALLSSSDIQTGATNSNKTILNALIYATANYDYYIGEANS